MNVIHGTASGKSDSFANDESNCLISDLSDKAHNITFHETLANMKVRVYGDAAVATYTETYDALSSASV